jgi:ubiquinol-cytochrome c reductase cytochrome c1 subunit
MILKLKLSFISALRPQLAAVAMACAALVALAANPAAQAAGSNYPLDHFPKDKLTDQSALQNGAKLFVNHCLNCHSAAFMRYNRLRDIGLTDDQIRANLLFTADKVGEVMKTSMTAADAKNWFGAVPPDLSVIARARSSHSGSGSDWLYTYLRTYYRDNSRSTGWNNALYPNVGMPHILWEMQGQRGATMTEVKETEVEGKKGWFTVETKFGVDGSKTESATAYTQPYPEAKQTFVFDKQTVGGKFSQAAYDSEIADLVAYITYMSDPTAKDRTRIGVWVLMALGLFTLIAWQLNRVFWKDIK